MYDSLLGCTKQLPTHSTGRRSGEARDALTALISISSKCFILRRMNILIVEDEKRLAENIAKALTRDTYNTSIVFDGMQAERAVALGHFDLIIMDRQMPHQDGLTTLQHLRAAGNQTPILLLTALSQTEDKITGLDAGADDYLTKPFELAELRARVRALLRRPEQQLADLLSYDTLSLDRLQKKAYRANVEITLSATEYRLLEYLLLHPETVLAETTLLEHIWDQNYEGLSNVVAVYIRYLRNKIDKAFPDERAIIKTVRGLGYTLST